ncbi:MAG: DUF3795 domain-containing protein [Candidatus Micrarchaeota archaeon]
MTKERDLIAYCGLYCGDCIGYRQKAADLARDLRKELRETKFDKTAEYLATMPFFAAYKNYKECYEVLGALVKMRCKKACRGGGGPPFCKIRKCSVKKGYDGCWECDEIETCKHLDFLKPSHGDAHIKNLRKIKRKGIEEFLKGNKDWYSAPKGK